MNYVRVILSTLAVTACALYLGWIFFATSNRENELCDSFVVDVKDADKANFVDSVYILSLVKNKDLYPVGKRFNEIDLNKIEDAVKSCPMVLKAVCYRTPTGEVKVEMTQRQPVYRVMTEEGNYYVDKNHQTFPTSYNSTVEVPLLSGALTKEYAKDSLYDFMLFIKDDKFWREQTIQVYVDAQEGLMLIPRVGNHVILLGNASNFEQKLENVKVFYSKVINEVGWNSYSRIDVRYNDQIICTPNN